MSPSPAKLAEKSPDAVGSPDRLWSPDQVRLRLEDAGRTLMMLPLPRGEMPADSRSRWPEPSLCGSDAFVALVGADDRLKREFAATHNRIRLTPSARAVARFEEAIQWLWLVQDPQRRRICFGRALIHPVSERHVVSYRKLARLLGVHHDTVRSRHADALAEIARALTRRQADKQRVRRRDLRPV